MLVPTRSLKKHDLYKDFLLNCTIRDDLKPVQFEDFDEDLQERVTILYFLQPELMERAAFAKKKIKQVPAVPNAE